MTDTSARSPLLEVDGLNVSYPGTSGMVPAVRDVAFTLGEERLGIVGESGSGKSTLGRAILGLLPSSAVVQAGMMRYDGTDLLSVGERRMRHIRGREMTMILQDPKYSLNPVMSVGAQITETYRAHYPVGRAEAKQRAMAMLEAVHIRDAERVYASYPHQLSGGMGQRIMIAMMLITEPKLLVADEPTSALDVTIRTQILSILDELVSASGMGLILISHDLQLVSEFCDRVLIMYRGQVVDSCEAKELSSSTHPYTKGLLGCMPSLANPVRRLPVLDRERIHAT